MLNLQRGRRNSTPEQLSYMRGKRYELEKQKVSNASGNNQFVVKVQNVPQPDTAEKLAIEYDVSDKTIKRDAEFTRATFSGNCCGLLW